MTEELSPYYAGRPGESRTPALDKMAAVKDESQVLGEFLEWLMADGIALCRTQTHDEDCGPRHERTCGYDEAAFYPDRESIESLLARYFRIDLRAVEREKQMLLDDLRRR